MGYSGYARLITSPFLLLATEQMSSQPYRVHALERVIG